MKTVFTAQEGVKMNSELDFGSTEKIRDEFQFLMTTYETPFEEEYDYFYRITSDDYLQLAYSYQKSKLEIKAQYKLQFDKSSIIITSKLFSLNSTTVCEPI